MNKDKLTDPKDNTIENNIEHKKEDYTDSNGKPEDFIEDMTDSEATAIFKEAFYAEAIALEKEALAYPVEVDEEQMEALRRRILQSVGAEVEDIVDLEKEPGNAPGRIKATETSMPKDASPVEIKRKQRRFSPLARWAAVLVLACVGVLGVSMTSQAKGSGLWSSIQRLIGKEVRWDQENNGADRSISNPEEYKAIGEIEAKLEIQIPEFFYLPGEMIFSDYEIFEESGSFIMVYLKNDEPIYFEGWDGRKDTSANYEWEGEGKRIQEKINGTIYDIIEAGSDNTAYNKYYCVTWKINENKFMLSGEKNYKELQEILKNIKN